MHAKFHLIRSPFWAHYAKLVLFFGVAVWGVGRNPTPPPKTKHSCCFSMVVLCCRQVGLRSGNRGIRRAWHACHFTMRLPKPSSQGVVNWRLKTTTTMENEHHCPFSWCCCVHWLHDIEWHCSDAAPHDSGHAGFFFPWGDRCITKRIIRFPNGMRYKLQHVHFVGMGN